MSWDDLDEDLIDDYVDMARCNMCGFYYCTCCGCYCWMEDDEEEAE